MPIVDFDPILRPIHLQIRYLVDDRLRDFPQFQYFNFFLLQDLFFCFMQWHVLFLLVISDLYLLRAYQSTQFARILVSEPTSQLPDSAASSSSREDLYFCVVF